jgi:hypothetical protein
MLRIDPRLVESARQAGSAAEVIPLVEAAIALEHATIPPYLTAWLTLLPGINDEVADIIRSIFLDEMLHMGLMANLLIALGGEPHFADPAFVPEYPGNLPFGIGDDLSINLRKCDLAQIGVFIKIEKPEHVLDIPEVEAVEFIVPHFDTIGEFYAALRDSILRLEPAGFANPRLERQVEYDFDSGRLARIADAGDAVAAIDLIRLQGEGADTPFSSGEIAAHYYAFEQIAKRKKLHDTAAGPVFGPDPLPFDPSLVIDMEEGVGPDTYPTGSAQRVALEKFIARYSDMLRKLEQAFTGDPDQIYAARQAMLRLAADGRELLQLDSPTAPGRKAGVAFRYVP